MICRNCNKEFDDNLNICPHCGENAEIDYFSKMLEHAMGENTRSAEELEKLRTDMKKKKKNRRRNIVIAVISVVIVAVAAFGAYFFIFADNGGERICRGGFNGNTFSVYDENGNEIRTVSGGKYTKTEYTPDGSKATCVSYSGFVSFERFDYKDGMLKREYVFDGVKNYSYKSYEYDYQDNNPVRAFYSSNVADGMTENEYDGDGNKISVKNYDFESEKKQEYIYDSVGRLTGEKSYDLQGRLVYDKQYSYKSDGTLYLSSVNEIYEKDEGGNAVSYILTMINEDGTKSGALINSPEGYEISKIEYTYKDGNISAEKNTDKNGSVIYISEFTYNDHGDVRSVKTSGNGNKAEKWYTYKYYDNGAVSLKAESPSEKSEDYTSYIEYDKNGRELKNITVSSHYEYKYDGNGNVVSKSSYSPSAKYLGRIDYEYENGFLKSETEYDSNGSVSASKEFTSDEHGNPVYEDGSSGMFAYINDYNEEGDLVGTKTYKLTSSETYEYNSSGLMTKKSVFNESGFFVSSTGCKYFKSGKVSDEYTYDVDGNVVSHVKYHYDDEGNQDGLTTYNSDGDVSGEAEISYDDKKKTISLENKDGEGNVIFSVFYNYSTDKPSLKVSGTVSDSAYENVYGYNDSGELESVTYSREGKIVSSETYSYNETGNIIKSVSERNDTSSGKYVYKYKFDGLYLKNCTVIYPDGTENTVSYGIDDNKKPYLISGDKE